MKRLICWLIGHDTDLMDPYNTRCFRCGHEWDYGDHPRVDLWFWLSWYDWRGRMRFHRFREWLRCPYCKKRFGHHDYDECIPF